MTVLADAHYLRSVIPLLGSDTLEIGSRDWQGGSGNMSRVAAQHGVEWSGCDLEPGPGVDFQIDILDANAVAGVERRWSSVLVFNLLEHVFDPATALRNCTELVEPGGVVVVLGPAVWELHDFPADYWRPLPDFYLEFARRHRLEIVDMTWVIQEFPWWPRGEPRTVMIPVEDLTAGTQKQLPCRLTAERTYGVWRARSSIAIQRALNLTGRSAWFPKTGLGVVLRADGGHRTG